MDEVIAQPDETPEPESHAAPSRTGLELAGWIDQLYEEAAKRRKDDANEEVWANWLDCYWGDQWPQSIPTYKAPIVVNEQQTEILRELSDLLDRDLLVIAKKRGANDTRAVTIERSIQSIWVGQHVWEQVLHAALNAFIFPAGFLLVTWDAVESRVDIRSVPTASIYPDPDQPNPDRWRYWIMEDVKDLVEIQELYPETGKAVKPDEAVSVRGPVGQRDRLTGMLKGALSKYLGPMSSTGSTSNAATDGYLKARATVLTAWVKDPAEDIDVQTKEDGTLDAVKKPKYPHGRLIVKAGDVILFDGPSYKGHSPLVPIRMLPSPDRFWPKISPVGTTMELQKASNRAEQQVLENALRLNNGLVITDSNSGIQPGSAAPMPGMHQLIRPGTRYEIKYPPPMPGDMVQLGERLRAMQRQVQGFSGARETSAKGNVSADLAESDIATHQGMTRLRARLLHQAVQRVVQCIFERLAEFKTVPGVMVLPSSKDVLEIPWEPVADRDEYSIYLDPSMFEIKSKTRMQREALMLAKLGRLSTPDLYEMLDISDATARAQRWAEEMQMQATIAKQKMQEKKERP